MRPGALARPRIVTLPAFRLDESPAPATPIAHPAPVAAARWRLLGALLAIASTLLFAWWVLGILGAIGLDRPLRGSSNAFFRLFAITEPSGILVLGVFTVAVLVAMRGLPEGDDRWPALLPARPAQGMALALVAFAVLVVCWAGATLVMHRFALAMDEYNASFQAAIIAQGRMSTRVPDAWSGWVVPMIPIFTTVREGAWLSTYLPGYATVRAGFLALGAEWLTNPALAALSVVLLALIARRLWPDDARRQWLSVAFLAASTQFLVMSMTAYAMPAHLAVNLLWLWLYLRDDRASLVALPLLGVAALGLHNPFPHALFIAPFLLRMLRRKRFGALAYIGVVYLAGAAFWLVRMRAVGTGTGSAGVLSLFQVPGTIMLYVQGMSLALTFTWQTPVAALCVLIGLFSWRELDDDLRDISLGICLTFAFYFFFASHQGHGWGYRYLYGVLGNIALVAAAGVPVLARAVGTKAATRLVAASLLVSVAVQLPLRGVQAERFVRPFASASAWLASQPADAVLVPIHAVWYGQDLIRNEPNFAPGPRIMVAGPFTPALLGELRKVAPRVQVVTPEDLAAQGMELVEAPK